MEEDKGKANNRQPQSTRNATHVAIGSNIIVRDKALQQLRPNNPESRRKHLENYEKTNHKYNYKVKRMGGNPNLFEKYRRDQTTLGMMAIKKEHSQEPNHKAIIPRPLSQK